MFTIYRNITRTMSMYICTKYFLVPSRNIYLNREESGRSGLCNCFNCKTRSKYSIDLMTIIIVAILGVYMYGHKKFVNKCVIVIHRTRFRIKFEDSE